MTTRSPVGTNQSGSVWVNYSTPIVWSKSSWGSAVADRHGFWSLYSWIFGRRYTPALNFRSKPHAKSGDE